MNICLVTETIIQSGLTWEQATAALQLANQNPYMQDWTFSITGHGKEGWNLAARHNELTKAFILNPKNYVIEV